VFQLARERKADYVLVQGYADTSLLSYYGPDRPAVAQADEPERWTFRPPIAKAGVGLAFGRSNFDEGLRRRFASVMRVDQIQRDVFGEKLEAYSIFIVEQPLGGDNLN
jgi:hypothetical protein